MEKQEIEHFVDELAAEDQLPGPTRKPGVFRRFFVKEPDEKKPPEPSVRERVIDIQASQGALLDRLNHVVDEIKQCCIACSVPPPPPPVRRFDIAQPANMEARLLALSGEHADYLARLVSADIASLKEKLSPSELRWRTEVLQALSTMFEDGAQ